MKEIALAVKSIIGQDIEIETVETNDNRSYHISSQKMKDILNFNPKFTIKDAVHDLKTSFEESFFILFKLPFSKAIRISS